MKVLTDKGSNQVNVSAPGLRELARTHKTGSVKTAAMTRAAENLAQRNCDRVFEAFTARCPSSIERIED